MENELERERLENIVIRLYPSKIDRWIEAQSCTSQKTNTVSQHHCELDEPVLYKTLSCYVANLDYSLLRYCMSEAT